MQGHLAHATQGQQRLTRPTQRLERRIVPHHVQAVADDALQGFASDDQKTAFQGLAQTRLQEYRLVRPRNLFSLVQQACAALVEDVTGRHHLPHFRQADDAFNKKGIRQAETTCPITNDSDPAHRVRH